jgi:TolB-like protein
MTANPDREIAFGPFRLDVRGRTLYRDGNGVALGSRSLDILCALATSSGELISKDDLMARVWPGVVVEDNTVQVHVSALRKALGEASGGPRFIVTVPGQGYRFVAEPAEASPALPDKPSIAVLPFQNFGGDVQDYFADGMVEDIITALTRFPALFVIARNSSFTYKGRSVDIRQVGRELGVRYVLEGSVRRSDDRLRITGQLIDTATGAHLWADRFDGGMADIFALQDEVAARVVAAIVPKLERAEIERANRKPTASLQAYDHYLRGLAAYHRETIVDNATARSCFVRAIALDAEFAAAHAMAAMCYSQCKRNGWPLDETLAQNETTRLAWRAAGLAPDDAAVLSTAGIALGYIAQDVEAARGLIDRALELNPNLATAWSSSAWVYAWAGESDRAIAHAERSMRLNPLDPLLPAMEYAIAIAHFMASRYDLAIAWSERAILKRSNNMRAMRILAASHALAGRLDAARDAAIRLRASDPMGSVAEIMRVTPFRRPDDRERYRHGLILAGLAE